MLFCHSILIFFLMSKNLFRLLFNSLIFVYFFLFDLYSVWDYMPYINSGTQAAVSRKTIKCHLCKIYRLYMYMYPCTWTDEWNLIKNWKYFCYFNLHLSSKTTWKTECLADLLETDFSITYSTYWAYGIHSNLSFYRR